MPPPPSHFHPGLDPILERLCLKALAKKPAERFKSMAAELVSLNVDVLIAVGNNAAPYATSSTTAIPVVFTLVGDPVGLKLVDNLARPGGNVTGIANFSAELIPKRLDILKGIIPWLSRVALLANMNARISGLYINLTQAAAVQLGLKVETFEVRSPDDLQGAFEAMTSFSPWDGPNTSIVEPSGRRT